MGVSPSRPQSRSLPHSNTTASRSVSITNKKLSLTPDSEGIKTGTLPSKSNLREPRATTIQADNVPANTDSDSEDSYWDLDINFKPEVGVLDAIVAKAWHPNNPSTKPHDLREYHTIDSSDYVFPSDEIEQDRIELIHYLLRHVFKSDIICPSVRNLMDSAKHCLKVLDVGCAKGFWLDSVQKVYPKAEYHGVDIAEKLINGEHAPQRAEIVFGNILDRLPYSDNSFDFVHQRLLMMGIPKHYFPACISELIRVTKPGGYVELIETDIILGNMGPIMEKYTKLCHEAMTIRAGVDGYAATNLPFYVKVQGKAAAHRGVRSVRIPLNWNGPIGKMAADGMVETLMAMMDWLHLVLSISRKEYQELVDQCVQEWGPHKTFVTYQVVYFQVVK
ncbi:hypothetical protein HK100_011024 [Physocladia obscura]|uniref:Methyltransferase domain-containing protein n=1 Tax=Physocladia obscura TaxID=109957 RepID=A0AAD5T4I0_9FUNG|nr:hypothetical protein HK100_011024 [Physocladia obscura]